MLRLVKSDLFTCSVVSFGTKMKESDVNMIERTELFYYIEEKYKVKPDYPWDKLENYAALRHKENNKWFGLVMDITEDKLVLEGNRIINVINLKVRKEYIDIYKQRRGVYTAYHMNKVNWVTVNLNELVSIIEIEDLIEESYLLTS